MSALEERFQAILSKSNQKDNEEATKKRLTNDLVKAHDDLKDLAGRIEDSVQALFFIDLNNFFKKQGFDSSLNSNKGYIYKNGTKQIEVTPTDAASRKIAFLVKQNLTQLKDCRIEVSFKNTALSHAMQASAQSLTIISSTSVENLSDWLRRLESDKSLLEQTIGGLSIQDLTFEYFMLGSRQAKKENTPVELIVSMLEK
ncbi:hypothetical protein QSV37_08995 [Acinetobacter sp. VNK23]|uniref:hypothetical protein n=1 Tax=Acinetobacter thutiue TaxID=2998078 RepID=UPI00257557A8|nr:hypothetical protein [Acinetobacter thutiue]MDM1020437.1 hypothetical protein [Acinetobacter thutiue]